MLVGVDKVDKGSRRRNTWRGVHELHGAVVLDGVDVGDEPEHGGERRELRVDGERRLLGALDEERAVGVDAGERAEAPELAVGGGGEVELADGVADLVCVKLVKLVKSVSVCFVSNHADAPARCARCRWRRSTGCRARSRGGCRRRSSAPSGRRRRARSAPRLASACSARTRCRRR